MPTLRSEYTDSVNFFGSADPFALMEEFGSPLYVYNEAILRQRCQDLLALSSHPGFTVIYSAKANANLSILRIVREMGLLADSMSPGELALQQAAGFTPENILYVCNNVSGAEMQAAHAAGVLMSLDSLSQLETYGTLLPGTGVMVRVNPGIGAGHHQKVITAGKETKFGISPEFFPEMRAILKRYDLKLIGLNQHIGSLFMEPDKFIAAMEWLLETARDFPGIEIIDFGGGFGIPYHKYDKEA
ncbi:diaminopimelate decarboxylase, partial [Desulfovibrio sp. OttesenSCG-928-I05]|nr:diaminopimelate decarboxylase [Desulfovibrio sp. OttesenSCG-928-I05]